MGSNLDYFKHGTLIKECNDVRVYELNDELYMESGEVGNLISSEDDLRNYIWQLGKAPYGDVLVLGLGLGLGVKYIHSLPKVNSITVVEPNKDIIACQQVDYSLDGYESITLHNVGVLTYLYEADKLFDYIFMDCYRDIGNDTWPFIADLVVAARKSCKFNGTLLGWVGENTSDYWLKAYRLLFT
jgi:hypothetical protein